MRLLMNLRVIFQQFRCIRHKPWIPKYKIMRNLQPWDAPIDLSSERKLEYDDETPGEMRARLRRSGILPPIMFHDSSINIGHTGQVTDPYQPPEGDGRASLLSLKRLKEGKDELFKKGKSYRETMKIKRHEATFDTDLFGAEAELVYKEAHILLPDHRRNENRLLELVTEKAFVEMTGGMSMRRLFWKFIASIEPPKVVHVRTQELLSKDNLYGQVTVRFHSQQILSIYNRFGRLIFGNPTCPVDVLEYVVLEKHLTDDYGKWRLHAKITPSWAPQQQSEPLLTRRLQSPTSESPDKSSSTAAVPVREIEA